MHVLSSSNYYYCTLMKIVCIYVRTIVRTLCRVMSCLLIIVILYCYRSFDCDFLSGLIIIKIEHDGAILTSFLARTI